MVLVNGDAVKREVLAELRWELGEKAAGIEVTADGGLVLLTGRTETTLERRRAVGVALRAAGVTDVVDGIGVVVSGGRPEPDVALARAARRAIERESFAPEERIKTVVCKGWVTLHGNVDHFADASDAERAVRRLAEGRGVTSLVEVGWIGSDSAGLLRAIESSIAQHAAQAARNVRVAERGDGAVLQGEVRSTHEKETVIAAAAHAARAARLIDEIRVLP